MNYARLTLIGALALVVSSAQATLFYGQDKKVTFSDPRPNSDAAHSAYLAAAAALGTVTTEDFESQPLGNPPFVYLADDLLLTMNNFQDGDGIITGPQNAAYGFNTTSGGEQYLSFNADDDFAKVVATFTFDTPINSFGAYISGVGTTLGRTHINWNDGTDHEFVFKGDEDGGCEYFGFTGAQTVTEVTVSVDLFGGAAYDIVGLDDMQFSRSTVPEPASFAVLGIGGLALLRRRKK